MKRAKFPVINLIALTNTLLDNMIKSSQGLRVFSLVALLLLSLVGGANNPTVPPQTAPPISVRAIGVRAPHEVTAPVRWVLTGDRALLTSFRLEMLSARLHSHSPSLGSRNCGIVFNCNFVGLGYGSSLNVSCPSVEAFCQPYSASGWDPLGPRGACGDYTSDGQTFTMGGCTALRQSVATVVGASLPFDAYYVLDIDANTCGPFFFGPAWNLDLGTAHAFAWAGGGWHHYHYEGPYIAGNPSSVGILVGAECPTASFRNPTITIGHGTSESPEISTRCLEYNIKAQRRDSIRVILPSNKPVPWSGTVTTFCDADPQATWQSYEASVIWNDKQIDLDTQASSLPAGQDTQMRIAAAIRNMAQSGLTTPASILSDNGGTRTAATIRPLGQGRYAIVASHRFSAPGHEHMMVIIQTRGRAHNAAPEFAYTEITAYVGGMPNATMIAAGRAQALRFNRGEVDYRSQYHATQALLAHSTNPWFTVGFFNSLDYRKQNYGGDGLTLLLQERDALAYVMGFKKYTAEQVDRHMIQAIVSALASGHASSAFTFAVLFRLRQETSGQGAPGAHGSYAGPFSYYDLGSAIAANVAAANNLVNLSYYNFDNFLNQRAFGENDYVMDDIAATIVADHIGIYATTNWAEATDADRQKSKYWQLLLVATQVPEGTTVAPTLAKLELAMGVWAGIHMPQHLVLSTCVKGRCRTDPYSGEIWARRTGYLARNLAEASVTHINDSNAARTLRANIYAGIAFWALPFAVPLAGDAIASFTAIEVSKGLVTAVADSVGLGSAIAVPFLPLGPSASDVSNVLRVTYAAQRQAAAKLIARLLLLHHVLLDCAAYPSHPCTPAPSLDLRSQPHGQVDNIECHGNDIVDRVAADGDVIDCAMRPNAAFILKDQFGHYSGMEARSNVFNYMLIWLPN